MDALQWIQWDREPKGQWLVQHGLTIIPSRMGQGRFTRWTVLLNLGQSFGNDVIRFFSVVVKQVGFGSEGQVCHRTYSKRIAF